MYNNLCSAKIGTIKINPTSIKNDINPKMAFIISTDDTISDSFISSFLLIDICLVAVILKPKSIKILKNIDIVWANTTNP